MQERIEHNEFSRLRRTDKYYLGSGDGLIYAPPHPLWLDRPGFWDGVHFFRHLLRPAFTVSFLTNDGAALDLTATARHWMPAELRVFYGASGLHFTEHRIVRPGGLLVSEFTIENARADARSLSIVLWTAVRGNSLRHRHRCSAGNSGLECVITVPDVHGPGKEIDLEVALSLEPHNDSWGIAESQGCAESDLPQWSHTPLRDVWRNGRLRNTKHLRDEPAGSTRVFLGISRRIDVPARGTVSCCAMLRLQPADERLRFHAVGSSPSENATVPEGRTAAATPRAFANRSEAEWATFFDNTPALQSSDPWFENYFAYRWFGLRLQFLDPAGNYAHPTVAEGTDFFHDAVSYSAWCHARELRWLRSPERARGVIRTFLQHQRPDGSMPGIIALHDVHPTASYFADWGGSLTAIDEVHPDIAFLEECYGPLSRYASFLGKTRDADASGLYRVLDPYETGQETMSRYTAVDATADTHHFDYRLHLLGVDLSVYMYRLHRALARIAAALKRSHECAQHDATADRIGQAVRTRMWNQDTGLFSDLDARTGLQTSIKAAVGFYPYMTDIAGPEHAAGLERNLFDVNSFWTPFPVPSTAADDPTFDADGFWKGVRQNCPWNGRVWPMTNSHIAEALAAYSITHAPHLRERAGDFLRRFIRMMFHDGDPGRPNSFEHYSPITGTPCTFRGLDDYQHSWVNDLIIRWVIGFRPSATGFVVDPLPCGLSDATLARLPFRGNIVTVRVRDNDVSAEVDGQRYAATRGEPLPVQIP
jgi:hypothetical protein